MGIKRMKGERVMAKKYTVGPVGNDGISKAVVLHPDIQIFPRDLVQFSDLGDGTYRLWKAGEAGKKPRRRKTVDSRRRRV